jgi:hypothetical protein
LIVWMKRRDVNTLGGHNDGFIRYNRWVV